MKIIMMGLRRVNQKKEGRGREKQYCSALGAGPDLRQKLKRRSQI